MKLAQAASVNWIINIGAQIAENGDAKRTGENNGSEKIQKRLLDQKCLDRRSSFMHRAENTGATGLKVPMIAT